MKEIKKGMDGGGRGRGGILGGMWSVSDHVCWLDYTRQQAKLESLSQSTKGHVDDRKRDCEWPSGQPRKLKSDILRFER